jgi:hypothetical protein
MTTHTTLTAALFQGRSADMDEAMKAAVAVIACSTIMLAIVSFAMLTLSVSIG